jgi:hypothetical protein
MSDSRRSSAANSHRAEKRYVTGLFGRAVLQILVSLVLLSASVSRAQTRSYENLLKPIKNPKPLLADFPNWIEPITEANRFEAPLLVDDEDGDLSVRAWRYSFNVRGIVEVPNLLHAKETAIILVHPWALNDGGDWRTLLAGVAHLSTPQPDQLIARHTRKAINPFLKSLRGKVGVIIYTLPGSEDTIRKKMYRSFKNRPTDSERREAADELKARLAAFSFRDEPMPESFPLSADRPVVDYFKQFPMLDSNDKSNASAYLDMVPITANIDVAPGDLVCYDRQRYAALKKYLQEHGIRHVLLGGAVLCELQRYTPDLCNTGPFFGYENLAQDFNLFLVGDAALTTFPAASTPRFTSRAHISAASVDHLVTQISWIRYQPPKTGRLSKK